jgi:Fe-S cluster assembly protein SufD
VNRTAESPLSPLVEALASRGPSALAALRRAALDAYLAAPEQDRSLHLWRYTDPKKLLPDGLRVPAPGDASGDGLPASALRSPALLPAESGGVQLPAGVEVRDLAGRAGERFASLSSAATGRYEALNLALFDGGAFVRVGKERRLERPLTLVHHAGAPGTLTCTRTLVVVEEGAEAALVEEFDSPVAGDGLLNAVTEIFLAPGARLVHTTVNTLGGRVRANVVQRARLEAGASLVSVSVSLGAAIFKLEASAELAGPGAHSEVLGAVFGTGRQHLDDHFFQDHVAPRTRSDLLVRVALMERARASYTGRLRIAVDAPGSEAHQENRNLLLSEAARADSIPELEILTHEVQCSHAAATGPVDPAMLFYLRSRGVSGAEAERLIVLGFLEPVFARIPGEALAEAVRGLAARRLGGE